MRKSITVGIIIAAVMLAAVAVDVAAGDLHEGDGGGGAGNGYYDLTFWRQLKLGTAYYVNPDLVARAKVLYIYSWDDLIKNAQKDALFDDVKTGVIQLAKRDEAGTYDVKSALKILPAGTYDAASFPAALIALAKEGYSPVGQMDVLYGVDSKGAIVSWDAEKPKTSAP